MATILSENNYGGLFGGADVIARTLLANKSIDRGLLNPIMDVKNKKTWRIGDYKPKLQRYSSKAPVQGDNLNLGEFSLELVKYVWREEFDLEILRTTWESEMLRPGSINDAEGTVEFNQWLFNYVSEQLAILNEKLYWTGKAGLLADELIDTVGSPFPAYDGLIPKMIADAGVFKVAANIDAIDITAVTTGTTTVFGHASGVNAKLRVGDLVSVTGIVGTVELNGRSGRVVSKTATSTTLMINSTGFTAYTSGGKLSFINVNNITEVMEQVIALQPRQAILKSDFKLHLPGHLETSLFAADAFRDRDTMFRTYDDPITKRPVYLFGQYEIAFVEYFPVNTVLGATSNDLYVGLDLKDEEQTLNIVDKRFTTGDMVLDATCVMKTDVNYPSVKAQDFLLYLPQ